MKKFKVLLSTMALFGVFLAACSPANPTVSLSTLQPTPAAKQSSGSLPNTGGDNPAASSRGNNRKSTQPAYPSVQSTQVARSNQPYPPAQSTQAKQSSSAANTQFDPGHLSNLLRLKVLDQNNQQIGTIRDMVLNISNLKVEYVIVIVKQSAGTPSQETAVPWDMLKLQTINSQNGQTGNSQTFLFSMQLNKN
jgi:sporulation protein YlmC with PRC-barrel domain